MKNPLPMTWVLSFILLLLLVLGYFLFAPFYLEVDSKQNLLRVRLQHLAEARLLVGDGSLMIRLRVARWSRLIDLLESREGKKRSGKARSMGGTSISLNRLQAIARSFKVNRFNLDLDFGDVALNGMLYPLFYWMSRKTGKQLRIDFNGVNEINLQVENNAARLIMAYISKSYYK